MQQKGNKMEAVVKFNKQKARFEGFVDGKMVARSKHEGYVKETIAKMGFVIGSQSNDVSVKASEFGSKITKRHICFTNQKRKELNEHMMSSEAKVKASRNKATIIELEALDYDDNSQKVKLYAGLPVIARVNSKDLDICNNDTMTVSKVMSKTSVIEITREDSSKFDVKFDMFQKLFHPAYAITSHKAQGSTYDHEYTIWEWNHPRFDNRAKYVVLSRSTKYEYINIR